VITVIGQVFGILKRIEKRLDRIEKSLREVMDRLNELAKEVR